MQSYTQNPPNRQRMGWEIPVSTPAGEFPTAAAAANWHGFSHGAVINRLRSPAFPDWSSPTLPKQFRAPLYSKQPPVGPAARTRACLHCGTQFKSAGHGNRLCDDCRAGDGLPEGWQW